MAISSLETAEPILADTYLGFLKYLKKEQKVQIIHELVKEIADYPSEQENSLASIDKFCGAWKSEKSTEEIASEIKNARLFNREVEDF